MFTFNNLTESEKTAEGVTRKILSRGGSMMAVEVTFKKGYKGKEHSHVHEQISYIVNGSVVFSVNGETKIVKKGDSIYLSSGLSHGVVESLEEDSVVLDVFTPQREDFLK